LRFSGKPIGGIDDYSDDLSGKLGGILNIPFLLENANANAFAATFWIETLIASTKDARDRDTEEEFMQLQYSQTAILEFGGREWPHITVGTLFRQ
jgi:hypothetical protein